MNEKNDNSWYIKNASYVVTGNNKKSFSLRNVDIEIKNGIIVNISNQIKNDSKLSEIDASNCVIYPGIVNTHHHLFQSILKGIYGSLEYNLAQWLLNVPWHFAKKFNANIFRVAVQVGIYDLLMSGATSCADHHYLYYKDSTQEMTDILFEEAANIGIKLVLCRGFSLKTRTRDSISNECKNNESLDILFRRMTHTIEKYHQDTDNNSNGVVIAPGTPFHSCELTDLKEIASFARFNKIKMHSHLSETYEDYVAYCEERYKKRPTFILGENDWLGNDVWFAHSVHVSKEEIRLLAETGTGVSHCPTSNARLGSGIAPISSMLKNGVQVGIGVDGSASAETANAMGELNLARLLQKSQEGANVLNFNETINMGCKAGADMIGLHNTGVLEIGAAADMVVYDLNKSNNYGYSYPEYLPLLSSGKNYIRSTLVNGRMVVQDNAVLEIDIEKLNREVKQAVNYLRQM